MSKNQIVLKDLSYKIIGLAMEIQNELGCGFLEKVYENALMVLFRVNAIHAAQQIPIEVTSRGENVGQYFVDILVEDKIILELKCVEKISEAHKAQALNYLKATGKQLAIIIIFGKQKLEYERFVL